MVIDVWVTLDKSNSYSYFSLIMSPVWWTTIHCTASQTFCNSTKWLSHAFWASFLLWSWRQCISPKLWYSPVRLCCTITQKTTVGIYNVIKTTDLVIFKQIRGRGWNSVATQNAPLVICTVRSLVFKSWPRDLLSWLKCFTVFLSF
jgi:hypothetical protein